MRAGGFPGNPGGLVVSILKVAGGRAPAHQARGRGRRTWRPTERTAGARMVPPGEGNEARGDGRRGVGVSHSTAEAGELSPRDPVEGRGHRQVAPLEGKTANTPRLGPVSTSRQRIAELARQAVGMAVAIAWLPGPAGTRRRVAKLSVEEPDAAEPARPDLWGARVSNDPGLPDRSGRHLLAEHPHNRLWVTVNHGQQDAGGAIWNTASLFPFLHGTHVETESVRKFLATQLHALPYRKNMLCRRIVDDAAR